MILRFLIISALLLPAMAHGQLPDKNETTFLYRQEAVAIGTIHTAGWGFGFRYGRQKTVKKKLLFGLDLSTMKHPKEVRVVNSIYDEAKGYIYGKLNSFTLLRPQIGVRRILFNKKRERGVEVGYVVMGGITAGLLKPIYLEICRLPPGGGTSCTPSIERYDPEEHAQEDIFGKAPGTKGINEIKLKPGLSGKFGMYFEFDPLEDGIKAVEVGVTLDAFTERVPVMAVDNNQFIYQTFYISLLFGKKMF